MRDPLLLRVGMALARALLTLLPGEFRRQWGTTLLQTSRDRQVRALERGITAFASTLLGELADLAATAVRARRPDAWSRRTDPGNDTPSTPVSVLMEHFLSDVRFALRTFRRRAGMMSLAAGSLALGIGASSAMFSVVDTVLLRPLPFPHPEELVSVYPTWPELRGHPTLGEFADRGTYSWPEYWALAEQQQVFQDIAAYDQTSRTLSGDGPPVRLSVGRATPNLFQVLGAAALRGRLFQADDDPRDGARSVILSEGFWRSRFAASPDVVGKTLSLNDESFTVVGVLPAEVEQTMPDVDLWVPITGSSADEGWGNHGSTQAVARLAAGVSTQQAAAEVGRILRESVPPDHGVHGGSVFPRLDDQTRNVRPALLVLIAASVLLLLVACGNVAAILLGAGIDRRQEMAVRNALGAGRRRIGRQLLTESLVLAGIGGGGGVLLAALLTRGLLFLAPAGVPRIAGAGIDLPVLFFAVAVAGLCGVLFGLAPALGLSRTDPAAAMGSNRGSTGRRTWLQGALVVGELALATVLLVSGALLTRTLLALNTVDPGFDMEGLVEVRMAPPYQRLAQEAAAPEGGAGFSGALVMDDAMDAYFQRFVDELASLPSVRSVAVTSNVPLTGDRGNNEVLPEGWDREGERIIAERRLVSANYFETLGLPIVEGRGFTVDDDRSDAAPTVIVSQGLADLAWPGQSALGKHLRDMGREARVVGVAADVRDEELESPTSLAFYTPMRQVGQRTGSLLLRTEGDLAVLAPAIRERIWSVDPDVPITRLAAFDENVERAVSGQRYRARLMVVFAVLAALFALMGVYGVTARGVARRTRELGIRVALGARSEQVARLVLRQGLALAALGAALGLIVSLFTGRYLEGMLFDVGRADPLSMVGIALLVALASLAASLAPSRRASRVDPSHALRAE